MNQLRIKADNWTDQTTSLSAKRIQIMDDAGRTLFSISEAGPGIIEISAVDYSADTGTVSRLLVQPGASNVIKVRRMTLAEEDRA